MPTIGHDAARPKLMATAAREDVAGDCTAFAGVVDVDNGNHRICSACVAKAGKRRVPAADSAGRAHSNARRPRMGGVRSLSLVRGLVRGRISAPRFR